MTETVSRTRSHVWVWTSVFIACLLGLAGTYVLYVEAPPPRRVVIATGPQDGAYYKFALQYKSLLEKEGVTLEVRSTHGTGENLSLLMDEASEVSIAFVQSGIADTDKTGSLQSLGSLYREPLWIFYRGPGTIDRLTQLKGLKIAVGGEGSGTRGIAAQLLDANGIDESQATYVNLGGSGAANALVRGEIDAAFFVAGVEAAYIKPLLKSQNIRLVQLNQAEAYERQFRYLSTVKIHPGLLDIKQGIPSDHTVLIAPVATLVSRNSLHPALVSLLLKVATKIHQKGSLLSAPGEFPSPAFTDIPLCEEAERFFKSGPPVLQRVLPFWLASIVDRLKVMVIPLIMLLMPLARIAPPLVRWQTRRKIYLWYAQLRQIDQKAIHGMNVVEARLSQNELRGLEKQIAHVGVPLSYMEEYYNLRMHLNLVSTKVDAIVAHGESNDENKFDLGPNLVMPDRRLQRPA